MQENLLQAKISISNKVSNMEDTISLKIFFNFFIDSNSNSTQTQILTLKLTLTQTLTQILIFTHEE